MKHDPRKEALRKIIQGSFQKKKMEAKDDDETDEKKEDGAKKKPSIRIEISHD